MHVTTEVNAVTVVTARCPCSQHCSWCDAQRGWNSTAVALVHTRLVTRLCDVLSGGKVYETPGAALPAYLVR